MINSIFLDFKRRRLIWCKTLRCKSSKPNVTRRYSLSPDMESITHHDQVTSTDRISKRSLGYNVD